MPKAAETMLDRLARTLKAREHSINRVDRRLSSWPEQVSRRGLDEAQLASENMQAAKKLEQEDEKLAIQAAKDRAVQQRENARFYVDTLKNAGRRR